MPIALITHPACLGHDNGPYHPECPDRLRAVLAALETPEFADLLRESAPHATKEQLTRVHPANYVDAILSIRPVNAPSRLRWFQVEVRNCRKIRDRWHLGCKFLQDLSPEDLDYFNP